MGQGEGRRRRVGYTLPPCRFRGLFIGQGEGRRRHVGYTPSLVSFLGSFEGRRTGQRQRRGIGRRGGSQQDDGRLCAGVEMVLFVEAEAVNDMAVVDNVAGIEVVVGRRRGVGWKRVMGGDDDGVKERSVVMGDM